MRRLLRNLAETGKSRHAVSGAIKVRRTAHCAGAGGSSGWRL